MSQTDVQTKAFVTVAEMARLCGLSPQRFHQLRKQGVFPEPVYLLSNRRPVYLEEQQRKCLEVRRRNCGINGRPVLFYSRSNVTTVRPTRRRQTSGGAHRTPAESALLDAVRALGLAAVTKVEVEQAVAAAFPQGTVGVAEDEVIRRVFLQLRRRDSTG